MASHISFVISGTLLVLIVIVVQSIPIDRSKEDKQIANIKEAARQALSKFTDALASHTTPATTPTSSPSTDGTNDKKKKRYIDDEQLDAFFGLESDETESDQLPSPKLNDQIEHTLHTQVKESPASIQDNAAKAVDTDDSEVFSDAKMTPSDLTEIVRRRRSAHLTDETNRRRKRALSAYDFYDTDVFYNPYARTIRSFAPLYWYPISNERSIRSALVPSYYELSDQPTLYSGALDSDESDEDPLSFYDDDIGYESNRYPFILPALDSPYDNLQLQQQYNTDDLPTDEDIERLSNDDDDDVDEEDEQPQQYYPSYQRERPSYTLYGPTENDFR